MDKITEKFKKLGVDNAPGQEKTENIDNLILKGEKLEGEKVDFSHGDIDAHLPLPRALETFIQGFNEGGSQAYTEYKGKKEIREYLSQKLSSYIQKKVDDNDIIITPGTQGALFLALGSLITRDTKVAIIEPDYFANRKLVEFFEGELHTVKLNYLSVNNLRAGIDLVELEKCFKNGIEVFLFSNPNNPTGVIYSEEEIKEIAILAKKYNVILVVDELYSRQIFDGRKYFHIINQNIDTDNLITIIGPSKTESLSGFRLGVAFGSKKIIQRMEKLQAIVSLRAGGYNQSVIKTWFSEPEGFMENRIKNHQEIRDELVKKFNKVEGVKIRKTEAGSYIFPTLPELEIDLSDFIKILRVYANVIVTAGTEFGSEYKNSIRLNFSQDYNKAIKAVDRIINMIERYRK